MSASTGWLVLQPGIARVCLPPRYTYEELDAEFTAATRIFKTMAERGERVAIIVDLYDVTSSNSRNRTRIAAAMKEVAAVGAPFSAQLYVIKNPIVRTALTAINWAYKPPWPVEVVGTRAEASLWLDKTVPKR